MEMVSTGRTVMSEWAHIIGPVLVFALVCTDGAYEMMTRRRCGFRRLICQGGDQSALNAAEPIDTKPDHTPSLIDR